MGSWSVWLILMSLSAVTLPSCSPYDVVPDHLEPQLDQTLSLQQIKQDPSRYQGQLVLLGGEVLGAKRFADRTELEVLHLPLSERHIPLTERTQSQGRFYAIDGGQQLLDPAQVPEGTPVTVIGEVTGVRRERLGESEGDFPTVRIRDLTSWEKRDVTYFPSFGYPYYGGYYWYGIRPFGYYAW